MYGVLSQIEAQLSLKNAWLLPIFFLDTKSTYEDLLYLHSFKPRKNIPALVSISGRRGGLMVSALDSGSSGPGSGPGRGHCVVFLGKTLYSHGASLHPGV